MTVRLLLGGLAGLACGAALAQPPAIPTPAVPAPVTPATHSQPDHWTAEVGPSKLKSSDGAAALPKALADARSALLAARDYTCTLVRQEKVNGVSQAEQTCSLSVRHKPAAVRLDVTAPKAAVAATSYLSTRSTITVRHQTGTAPAKVLPKDDPAARMNCKYPVTGYGLAAVLDRVEGVIADQQRGHRPTQVLVADYTFAGKPVTRFEVFADRPSADVPRRLVLCVDAATKLPVRYEAYGPPTPGSPGGEVLEVVSFLSTKLNVGLGDAVFEK